METPIVCPYCWDGTIDEMPGAELFAKNVPGERRISMARIFHCRLWHIFAVFPQATVKERQTDDPAVAA